MVQIINLGRDGKIQIFTSEDIEQEILDKLMTKFGLNSDDAGKVMADFLHSGNMSEEENLSTERWSCSTDTSGI